MAAKITEDQEEKTLKEQLAAMPKKTIVIPRDPLNKNDIVPIGWNGIIYAVPRGKAFEVPYVIADIWTNAYEQTMKAEDKMEITENKEVQVYG